MKRLRALNWALVVALALTTSAACAQDSSSAERYAGEGQAALADGRYEDAQKAFEKLRQLKPGMAEVHANLGLIYFEERKFDEAVSALRQALKLKPTLAKSGDLLAMSLSELGRFSDAVPGLEKCLHKSEDAEIRRMCGLELQRAYTGLKRDSQAVEVAMELNRLYPNDPEILYQTGKIYGNFAFLTMEKLAQVAPTSVWRHLAAAEADESQGSYDQAIVEYRQVLRLEPQRPGIHYRIGRSLMGRFWQRHSPNDPPAAEQEFQQELQLIRAMLTPRMNWAKCVARPGNSMTPNTTSSRPCNTTLTFQRLNSDWPQSCSRKRCPIKLWSTPSVR